MPVKKSQEFIYTSEQNTGWGLSVWKEMLFELIRSRELIWRLFIRDFSVRYRQTLLGVVWVLVLPLITVATFMLLNRAGLLKVGETGVPYPVFALLGLTVWQIFANGLSVCSNAVISSGSVIIKINFPKETLVISALGQVIIELLVRLLMLGIILVFYGVTPRWTVVLFPLSLLPLLMLTLGIGFFLALVNVVFRDIGNLIAPVLQLLMFLTPVVYQIPEAGILAKLMKANPLTPMIVTPRELFFTGYVTDPVGFFVGGLMAAVFFLLSWRIFHMMEFKMAEVV